MQKTWCLLCGLSFFFTVPSIFAQPQLDQVKLMKEEYRVMSKMRFQLKKLLERQELEGTLEEGNDAFTSFYNMKQWLQMLSEGATPEKVQKLMEILKEFEDHLADIVARQQEVLNTLPSNLSSPQNQQKIQLSRVMDQIRRLVQSGQFSEAQDLINQMMELFNRQQQQLQNSISDYYESQFTELLQKLSQWNQNVSNAQKLEQKIGKGLQAVHMDRNQENRTVIPKKFQSQQREISQILSQMNEELKEQNSMMILEQLETLTQLAEKSSGLVESHMEKKEIGYAKNKVRQTDMYLKQLQHSFDQVRDRIKEQSRPRMSRNNSRNFKQYQSDKGVRPFRFEYDFQANPAYREAIQKFNKSRYSSITPAQKEYLQEVMK